MRKKILGCFFILLGIFLALTTLWGSFYVYNIHIDPIKEREWMEFPFFITSCALFIGFIILSALGGLLVEESNGHH